LSQADSIRPFAGGIAVATTCDELIRGLLLENFDYRLSLNIDAVPRSILDPFLSPIFHPQQNVTMDHELSAMCRAMNR
jgi:hypothetical protein